jgi:HK97 family phage prohead protease
MILEFSTGKITETQEAERNGQPVGRVSGLLTTYIPNRPFDTRRLPKRFSQGAFEETIQSHRDRDNRPIRMMLEHTDLIGGFPIDMVTPNAEGLHVMGEINMNTQLGRETYSLAAQGVLSDFSMGYNVTREHNEQNGDRIAESIDIFEGSITAAPANQGAKITSLESMTPRELERALILTGKFTRSMCKELAAKLLTLELPELEEAIEIEIDPEQEKQFDRLMSKMTELKGSL